MFDGSALPLSANLDRAVPLLERCARNGLILEIEAGVVGGEEDDISAEGADPSVLYTTAGEMLEVARRMNGVPGRAICSRQFLGTSTVCTNRATSSSNRRFSVKGRTPSSAPTATRPVCPDLSRRFWFFGSGNP